jgi:hypothetical protein
MKRSHGVWVIHCVGTEWDESPSLRCRRLDESRSRAAEVDWLPGLGYPLRRYSVDRASGMGTQRLVVPSATRSSKDDHRSTPILGFFTHHCKREVFPRLIRPPRPGHSRPLIMSMATHHLIGDFRLSALDCFFGCFCCLRHIYIGNVSGGNLGGWKAESVHFTSLSFITLSFLERLTRKKNARDWDRRCRSFRHTVAALDRAQL